jgi:hypothetical protein
MECKINYEIIKDKEKLLAFINWLPELEPDEFYYICLFARTKYVKNEDGTNMFPHIQTDKSQLKRVLSKKEYIYDKIKQLECEVGSYTSRGISIPQEALALYITFNPHSMVKAAKNMLKKLADFVTEDYNGYNIVQEAFSEVHKAVKRKIYLDFDFDTKNYLDVIEQVNTIINSNAVTYLKTRGGLHVLIESKKIDITFSRTWYNNLVQIKGFDKISNSSMIPVVGTYQGGFIPYFIQENDNKINKNVNF